MKGGLATTTDLTLVVATRPAGSEFDVAAEVEAEADSENWMVQRI